jgi:hypothetical protein
MERDGGWEGERGKMRERERVLEREQALESVIGHSPNKKLLVVARCPAVATPARTRTTSQASSVLSLQAHLVLGTLHAPSQQMLDGMH